MSFSVKQLITGDLNRLKFVHRFATAHVNHRENVAEHSYFVALYSLLIAEYAWAHGKIKDGNKEEFISSVCSKAILHDIEESVTGDMPRPFKYRSNELRLLLEKEACRAVEEVLSKLSPIDTDSVGPDLFVGSVFDSFMTSKDQSYAGRIVSFADYLSVVAQVLLELESSNWTMTRHIGDLRAYGSTFNGPDYDFLRELVVEIQQEVENAFSR